MTFKLSTFLLLTAAIATAGCGSSDSPAPAAPAGTGGSATDSGTGGATHDSGTGGATHDSGAGGTTTVDSGTGGATTDSGTGGTTTVDSGTGGTTTDSGLDAEPESGTCDDSIGTSVDCNSAGLGACGEGTMVSLCMAAQSCLKPRVAQDIVDCLKNLPDTGYNCPPEMDACVSSALAKACEDPSAAADCEAYAAACPDKLEASPCLVNGFADPTGRAGFVHELGVFCPYYDADLLVRYSLSGACY